MSEYQHYEFQALDRPLDVKAQRALRRITTRALITSHSLVNTYQWGDFKGDPERLVEQWFDLFVYWANWGTRTTMFRFPRRFVDVTAMQRYRVRQTVRIQAVGEAVIVTVGRDLDPPPDELPEEAGISAPLCAVRGDLLRGDLRCLYLGWLLGVQDRLVADAALEPPRPRGLAHLSGALSGFATFFGLDADLLAAACDHPDNEASPRRSPSEEPTSSELRTFIATLSEAEKTELLRRAVAEPQLSLALAVRRRWAAAGHAQSGAAPTALRRTVRDLRAAAVVHAEQRKRREAAEQARRVQREHQLRERRLAQLAGREDETWRRVEELVAAQHALEYDQATELLKDLETLAERDEHLPEFRRRIAELCERHRRKWSLIDRIRAAGLPAPKRS